MIEVNYLAVVLGAVVTIVVGFFWYGPVFGKKWIALSGIPPEALAEGTSKKGMLRSYPVMILGALVMAYVLFHVLVFAMAYTKTSGWTAGVSSGFWMWLGFVAPVTMGSVLWERKSWTLWFINAGYYLVSLVLMGALLGAMM